MSESSQNNPIPFPFGINNIIGKTIFSDQYNSLNIKYDGLIISLYDSKVFLKSYTLTEFIDQILPLIEDKEGILWMSKI